MSKKKICLVIPSLQAGGMERVMSEIARYFARKDEIELHLILYGITREIFYSIPESILIHKPSFRFNNRWRLFYTLKTLYFLRIKIKEIKPTCILSFGEYWNNFLLLSILGLNQSAYISDRSQPDKSLGWLDDKLRHLLYPMANGLILQTEKAKDLYLTKNRHHNIAVIGNPIRNFYNFKFTQEREKNILMVGRLIKSKHQDKLIEMFAKVSPSDWKLIVVGYDHLKQNNLDKLKRLTKDLDVEQRVVFTGKQDNVDEIYLKSSIFAFTSSSEGFPNVIGEAMAAGLPVIAFDCVAGPSEMITDGQDGYLIPLFDYELFQSRMVELMKDEELRSRIGTNAKESIKKFSSEKICEAFYKFISE
jgi:GalNAc-alpha-(1->4)-GalNAc-alpha-(1->3)-diNAcBac-PP-undecaprenol alpha-1,4-N-acetyl-D-galactosaminyltransferase